MSLVSLVVDLNTRTSREEQCCNSPRPVVGTFHKTRTETLLVLDEDGNWKKDLWLTLGSRCGCSLALGSLPLVIDHWTLSAHAQPPSSGLHTDWNQPITAQGCDTLTNQRLPSSSHLASLVPGLCPPPTQLYIPANAGAGE